MEKVEITMKIELREIPIQDIAKYSKHLNKCQGYFDKSEEGVYGMEGRLSIRPKYQREFIYKDKQRDAVIHSIRCGFPLNVFYFAVNKDGSYEVIDGQQRLISLLRYIASLFSVKWPNGKNLYFNNLVEDLQDQILSYKLMVYFCSGTDSEKLDWFRTINIAGEKLTDQELRNAVYTGPWTSDAKRYFSRTGCPAYQIAGNLLKGKAIRQNYLETAINWISNGEIEEYMGGHQNDDSAKALWEYFVSVVDWTNKLFPKYRKEMRGIPWGLLYNEFSKNDYDSNVLEEEITKLMQDEDVTKKRGIYEYVLTRNEKYLSIRTFSDKNKREAYEWQGGKCVSCEKHFEFDEMQADHITPWSKGGKTISDNCQMLCANCNRRKGAK